MGRLLTCSIYHPSNATTWCRCLKNHPYVVVYHWASVYSDETVTTRDNSINTPPVRSLTYFSECSPFVHYCHHNIVIKDFCSFTCYLIFIKFWTLPRALFMRGSHYGHVISQTVVCKCLKVTTGHQKGGWQKMTNINAWKII